MQRVGTKAEVAQVESDDADTKRRLVHVLPSSSLIVGLGLREAIDLVSVLSSQEPHTSATAVLAGM
jgi:hypothetical protein